MSTEVKERKRKPRARQVDVIFGALDERVAMLLVSRAIEDMQAHAERLRDLHDELRRALRGEEKEGA